MLLERRNSLKSTKQMLAIGVLTATIIGGGTFATFASAQESTDSSDNLASKIASRFNLNQDEVRDTIREHRTERRTERLNNRLDEAVNSGSITEDQKAQIQEYLDENKPGFNELEDKTREERKEVKDKFREDFKAWAEENGIELEEVPFGHGHGNHHGKKGKFRVDDN